MADGKPDNSTHAEIKSLSDKFDTVHKKIDQSSADLRKEIDSKFSESRQDRITDKQEVSEALREDRKRQEAAAAKTLKVIGMLIGVAVFLIGAYLESVRRNLTDVTSAVNELVSTTNSQATKIEVIGERLNHQSELRTLFHKMESEVQGMKLEIERLKKQ